VIQHATKIILAILSITIAATAADATPRGNARNNGTVVCNELGCSDTPRGGQGATNAIETIDANGNSTVVGGRPTGCPRQFCGCEASLYIFGEIRPMLNVARNWRSMFPRTAPAPGMVAARKHHVMVLMSHVEGDEWLVHDGNSGGGLTREHVRSIRGYTIVNPHGARTADDHTTRSTFARD
jgi:hypothetical protein